jgi:hypothetical protein
MEEFRLEGVTVITATGSFRGTLQVVDGNDVISIEGAMPCDRCGDPVATAEAVKVTTESGDIYLHADCPELSESEKRFRWGDR